MQNSNTPERGVYRRAGFRDSVQFVAFDSKGELRLVVKTLGKDADDYIVGWMNEWLDRHDPVTYSGADAAAARQAAS